MGGVSCVPRLEGDPFYRGEFLLTGGKTSVVVGLENGRFLAVGPSSAVMFGLREAGTGHDLVTVLAGKVVTGGGAGGFEGQTVL